MLRNNNPKGESKVTRSERKRERFMRRCSPITWEFVMQLIWKMRESCQINYNGNVVNLTFTDSTGANVELVLW